MAALRASSGLGHLIWRVVVAAMFVALATQIEAAMAHTPGEVGYVWTCVRGEGHESFGGYCYKHHSNADARIYKVNEAAWPSSWVSAVRNGHNTWDQTNGHQFNYIVQTTNTTYNSHVMLVSVPCNEPNWAGCALVKWSGSHIIEGGVVHPVQTEHFFQQDQCGSTLRLPRRRRT